VGEWVRGQLASSLYYSFYPNRVTKLGGEGVCKGRELGITREYTR